VFLFRTDWFRGRFRVVQKSAAVRPVFADAHASTSMRERNNRKNSLSVFR
jgi:hypothetical protein